jgi:hypothetical protein
MVFNTRKTSKGGFRVDSSRTEELASEVKGEVQELASEAKEAVSGVVQLIVIALCGSLLVMMLGALLLIVAII